MLLTLSQSALKEYDHLPKSDQRKIDKKLVALQDDPLLGKKLAGELSSFYSLRAWPYRIIYEINEREKRIEVHKIAHRQGVYK